MAIESQDFLPFIKQISTTASSGLSPKKALTSIAKSISKGLEAEGASIMLLSPSKNYITTIASHGLSEMYVRKGAVRADESLPEVMNGKIVYIKDVSKGKDVQYPQEAYNEEIRGIIGVPLTSKGDIFGELRVYIQHTLTLSTRIKDFLHSAAGIIALLVGDYEVSTGKKGTAGTAMLRRKEKTADVVSPVLKPTNFGHPSEEQFAQLLDFYRIEWLYEPRSFPLAWEGKKIFEMFTPDFYLPDLDLYVELTTSKQSLITEKNRKIRLLKELYPEIKIKLLNKGDYLKMLAKYGHGTLGLDKTEGIDRVLFTQAQVQQRIKVLANRISRDYAGKPLVLVGVLKGVICFASDLMRNISLPLKIDFMAVSYFDTNDMQPVNITKDLDINIRNKDVLMVEDIVDTGMTLNYILGHLSARRPSSLKVCTLLDKKVRRLANVPLDYVGFEIPDEFVVGYGLDYNDEYRNLPFIGVLKPKPE
jgi:bifunctional protein TilS/HprT